MVMPAPEAIFVKVKDNEEKRSILEGIVLAGKPLMIKNAADGGEVLLADAIDFARKQLTCRLKSPVKGGKAFKEVILQFSVGTEK